MNKKYSYSLNSEMMEQLEREFQISPLIENYKNALEKMNESRAEKIEVEIFGSFGRNLADRVCELEPKYRDRSGQVAHMIAEQTGQSFPSIQQGPLEIGILAVMNANKWGFDEVSYKRLAFRVRKCVVNMALEKALGKEEADRVPCRHLCLAFYRGVCEKTGAGDSVSVDMPSKISDQSGYCLFEANYPRTEAI
jgi:hypothetical protein